MNLPNKFTMLRLFFVPFFVYFFFSKLKYGLLISMFIFAIASLTDTIDGYLARKYNQVTDFGKLMDPLADKILIMAALISFIEKSYIPSWFAIVVLSREFIVTGVRILAAKSGKLMPAGIWGKIKTVSQVIMIMMVFINFGIKKLDLFGVNLIVVALFVVFVLTFYSGYDYVKRNWNLINER